MLSLHDRIKALQVEHSRYGHNGILFAFSLEICRRIDDCANAIPFALKTVQVVLKLLKKYSVGYSDQLKSAFEIYSECAIFLEINDQNIQIERVPEEKNVQKPDFKISYMSKDIYLEAKILGWREGSLQYVDAIEAGLAAQIEIEDQLKAGKQYALSESEISPLGNSPDSFINPDFFTIETILAKLYNNIKRDQLTMGPSFLICDLTALHIIHNPCTATMLVHNDNLYDCYTHGILWHIAFGEFGDRILRQIEFEGKSNVSGKKLQRDGVLITYPDLIGIIFRIADGPYFKYSCLSHSKYFDQYGDFIVQISDYWNDEENSNAWKLAERNKDTGLQK